MKEFVESLKNGLLFQIKYTIYSLKKWPLIILVYAFCICFLGILEPLEVYFQKELISYITNEGHKEQYQILMVLSVYFFVSSLFIFQTYASPIAQRFVGIKVALWIQGKIHYNLQKCPMENLDNAEYQIKIDRAKKGIEYISSGPAILMYNLSYAISLLISTIYISRYSRVVILYYVIGIISALLVSKQKMQDEKLNKKNQIKERQKEYYKNIQKNKEMQLENRACKYNNFFINKWNDLNDELFGTTIELKTTQLKNTAIVSSIQNVINIFLANMLFTMVKNREIDIAAYLMIVGMGSVIIRYLEYLFNAFTISMQFGIYVDDIEEVLNIKEEKKEGVLGIVEEKIPIIEFNNVSFSYSKEKNVLEQINFKLKSNETIALIGDNGSGKTTLSLLALGLYKPKSGKVLLKGVDINKINKDEIRAYANPIFQDFTKYQFTVRENIGFGNLKKMDIDNELTKASSVSGFSKIMHEKKMSYKDYLGKEYEENGIELSGGEWQKVAISRGLMGTPDFIVFDEPTSALDPISEIRLLSYVKKYIANKAAIIVSHRVGICKLADKIIFLKNGKLIESGTHKELYEKRGEYFKYYNEQAKWYEWSEDEKKQNNSNL